MNAYSWKMDAVTYVSQRTRILIITERTGNRQSLDTVEHIGRVRIIFERERESLEVTTMYGQRVISIQALRKLRNEGYERVRYLDVFVSRKPSTGALYLRTHVSSSPALSQVIIKWYAVKWSVPRRERPARRQSTPSTCSWFSTPSDTIDQSDLRDLQHVHSSPESSVTKVYVVLH